MSWGPLNGSGTLEPVYLALQNEVICKLDENALCHLLLVPHKDIRWDSPRAEPCGTALVTRLQVENIPLITTL